MHEYIFKWEIKHQYIKYIVSVKILLNRGLDLDIFLQDDRLPSLQEFQDLIINMIVDPRADGYSTKRKLNQITQCFGTRAPVEEIIYNFLTDCPANISVDHDR